MSPRSRHHFTSTNYCLHRGGGIEMKGANTLLILAAALLFTGAATAQVTVLSMPPSLMEPVLDPQRDVTIVMENGRIRDMGPSSKTPSPVGSPRYRQGFRHLGQRQDRRAARVGKKSACKHHQHAEHPGDLSGRREIRVARRTSNPIQSKPADATCGILNFSA